MAQAEADLRRGLDLYGYLDQPLVPNWDGTLYPFWIPLAATYVRRVVAAFCQESLLPDCPDPIGAVQLAEGLPYSLTKYLFDKYFSNHALIWNHGAQKASSPTALQCDIDVMQFSCMVPDFEEAEMESTTLYLRREITDLWQKRAELLGGSTKQAQEVSVSLLPDVTPNRGDLRKGALLPILDERGWSIGDWATEADVDYHTVQDYMDGITKPYKSTKLKLAKALDISVKDLPE
jgi:hypothetical protein